MNKLRAKKICLHLANIKILLGDNNIGLFNAGIEVARAMKVADDLLTSLNREAAEAKEAHEAEEKEFKAKEGEEVGIKEYRGLWGRDRSIKGEF